jgi:hypothetical protein
VTNLLGYLLLSYYLFLEMLSILVRLDVAGKRENWPSAVMSEGGILIM